MKRILQIVPKLDYTGVAKVVLNYYEKIDKNEIVFDFITHGIIQEEDFYHDLREQGSRIIFCETIGNIGLHAFYLQLKNVLHKYGPYDVVHIHVGHITGIYAFMCKNLGVSNIICHAHTTCCPNPKHNILMPLLRILSVNYSNKLVACGEDAGRFCFGDTKFIVLKNGLDYQKLQKISNEEVLALRVSIGIGEEDFVVGQVAAFINQKNHRFSIDLFRELLKVKPNARLVLVGDGPLKSEIMEYVNNIGLTSFVYFLGIRHDVYALMKMFDVFILPSFFEGLPVVGIEAQAAGLQCILSNRIDKQVDIGLNSVEFLPIDKGVGPWVKHIISLDGSKTPSASIQSALVISGYDVNSAARELEKIYLES